MKRSLVSRRRPLRMMDVLEERVLLSVTPNDPLYSSQYYLNKIDASDAWGYTTGSNTVVIAVLDTGLDITNADIAANVWTNPFITAGGQDNSGLTNDLHGWNFVDNNNDVSDNFVHGTSVAAVIGAVGNNGVGTAGIGWNVKILPVVVGTSGGASAEDVTAGINYIIGLKKEGVNIVAINASYISFSGPSFAEISAISNAGANGMLYVAAAGNSSLNLDQFYPAGFLPSNLIFVAATDQNDQLASFSSYGSKTVAVGAPGVGIETMLPGGFYASLDGTSYSAPMVSGIVALLKSYDPSATMGQIKAAILNSGDVDPSLAGVTITGRRVNAYKALQYLIGNVPPIGVVEMLNTMTVTGYAYQEAAGANAISVQVSIDGVLQAPVVANLPRPDLSGVIPSTDHGFSFTMPTLAYGNHKVQVFALNSVTGAATLIGQGTVSQDSAPVGVLESTTNAIVGYAADSDTPTKSIQVKLFLDGRLWKTVTANVSRPDLVGLLGTPKHGFSVALSQLPAGVHRLDVYAVDTLTGATSLFGTATVSNNRAPTGIVESLTATSIVGYAFDPDAGAKSIQVRYAIDGGAPVFVTASVKRSDLVGTLGSANHGFNITLPQLTTGIHTIVVNAVDPTNDLLVQLASQTVTVVDPVENLLPTGVVSTLTSTLVAGTVTDANATGPLSIRVDVDGKKGKVFLSTATGDVTTDTFSTALKLSAGVHRIDVYALDATTNLPVLIEREWVGYTASTGAVSSLTSSSVIGTAASPSAKKGLSLIRIDIDGFFGGLVTVGPTFTIPLPPLATGTHHVVVTLIDPLTFDPTVLATSDLTFA